jgi:hypothetical protein
MSRSIDARTRTQGRLDGGVVVPRPARQESLGVGLQVRELQVLRLEHAGLRGSTRVTPGRGTSTGRGMPKCA